MRHTSKLLFIIFLVFCNISIANADEKWNDVTYFKRVDFKMRVIKHDPPIVLEWGKLVGGGELSDKLKAIAVAGYFTVMNIDYDEWKSYCTADFINALEMTEEEFEHTKKKINLKKDWPEYQFRSILYEVDYLIDGQEYSFIVDHTGPEKLEKFTESTVASLLKKENGVWKNHDIDNRLFYDGELEFSTLDLLEQDSVLEFSPYDLLTAIMEKGFVYMSKEHRDIYPFEPCETLRTDSYIPTWHRYNYLEGRPPSKQDNQ